MRRTVLRGLAGRSTRRLPLIVAALAIAAAVGTSASPANASVNWSDGNISEVRFVCTPKAVTIRATLYTYTGLNNYNYFRYAVYNWNTATWSAITPWEPITGSYTIAAPAGGNFTMWVQYQHRNTTDGRIVTSQPEWGEVLTTTGYRYMGRCYT